MNHIIQIVSPLQSPAMSSNCPSPQETDYRICEHWALSKAFLIAKELLTNRYFILRGH